MSLNATEVSFTGTKKNYVPLDAGTYPARLVMVVDCGLQPQRPYRGEEKEPAYEIALTYEFSDEFMKDDDGQELKDKPRWLTEFMPFHNLKAEKAKSTKRYSVFDPKGVFGGDFSKLLSSAVMLTIQQNPGRGKNLGRVFEQISGVSLMSEKQVAKLPALINPAKFFDLDNPDLDTFNKLPSFIQEKIKSNLKYKGSKLEGLLGVTVSSPEKKPEVALQADDEDSNPY